VWEFRTVLRTGEKGLKSGNYRNKPGITGNIKKRLTLGLYRGKRAYSHQYSPLFSLFLHKTHGYSCPKPPCKPHRSGINLSEREKRTEDEQ